MNGDFPAKKYCMYTVYTYKCMVQAKPTYDLKGALHDNAHGNSSGSQGLFSLYDTVQRMRI